MYGFPFLLSSFARSAHLPRADKLFLSFSFIKSRDSRSSSVIMSSSSSSSFSSAPVDSDVLIIGGGVSGLALALFMQKIGVSCQVYEAYPGPSNIGGGLQVASNGVHVLSKLGVQEKLLKRGAPCNYFSFRNHKGEVLGTAPLRAEERFGHPFISSSRQALHYTLLERMQEVGLEVKYGYRLKSLDATAAEFVVAEFENGETARGRLIVGADGLHSRVRSILFPNHPPPHFLGIQAYGGWVPIASLDEETKANLPDPHEMIFNFGLEGFFGCGMFGGAEGEEYVGWWTNRGTDKQSTYQELQEISDDEIKAELKRIYGNWHSPVPQLLNSSLNGSQTTEEGIPTMDLNHAAGVADFTPSAKSRILRLQLFDVDHLPEWYRGRILLIGDAAHAMSPNSGQGASVALEDAMYLAACLRRKDLKPGVDMDWTDPLSVTSVLAAFQRHRQPRAQKIVDEGRRRGQDKKQKLGEWGAWFRDIMFKLVFTCIKNRMGVEQFSYKIDWPEPEDKKQ